MAGKIIPFIAIGCLLCCIACGKSKNADSAKTADKSVLVQDAAPAREFKRVASSDNLSGKFKRFTMDKNYFFCDIPTDWDSRKTGVKKYEKGVYGLALLGPRSGDAPTMVNITFYLKGNKYFNGHDDFIESNSKDLFGEKETETDKYGPVEEIKLNDRLVYRFERVIKEYLHPESKSEDFIMLKEKFYIMPAEKGFYVLHFTSSASAYLKYLPIFEAITYSFRGV